MIRLAICDDDCKVVEEVESYIKMSREFHINYEVFLCAEELEKYRMNKRAEFDVYLLDIEMKEMSGLEVAKNIRKDNPNVIIIFLTSYKQYVYDVFEVITFDYILKPLTLEKFKKTFLKIEEYLGMTKCKFAFSYKKNSYGILYRDIKYLEKSGRKIIIHTTDGQDYECNMTIEEVWKQLNTIMFASLCKSCIVNLDEIEKIDGEYVVLKDKTRLFISRNYRKDLRKSHLIFLEKQC